MRTAPPGNGNGNGSKPAPRKGIGKGNHPNSRAGLTKAGCNWGNNGGPKFRYPDILGDMVDPDGLVSVPDLAFRLCAFVGARDEDLAAFFGVHFFTIPHWRKKFTEFDQAIRKGKDIWDSNHVESALLKRALGYPYTEVTRERQAVRDEEGKLICHELVTTKEVDKQMAPDPTSCMCWLNNRSRERWKPVAARVNGKIEHDHKHQHEHQVPDPRDGKHKDRDAFDAEVLRILHESGHFDATDPSGADLAAPDESVDKVVTYQ